MSDENSKDRVRLYRERKKLEVKDAGKPWLGLVGEEREQAIRDFYGYSVSETSTQAEREARADRITGSAGAKETLAEAEQIWGRQAAVAASSRGAKRDVAPAELQALLNGVESRDRP